jgi:hypothetical protein
MCQLKRVESFNTLQYTFFSKTSIAGYFFFQIFKSDYGRQNYLVAKEMTHLNLRARKMLA